MMTKYPMIIWKDGNVDDSFNGKTPFDMVETRTTARLVFAKKGKDDFLIPLENVKLFRISSEELR